MNEAAKFIVLKLHSVPFAYCIGHKLWRSGNTWIWLFRIILIFFYCACCKVIKRSFCEVKTRGNISWPWKNCYIQAYWVFKLMYFVRINVPCETLMRIPVPNTKTPLKKYRRPLPPRHTRDSWSDEVCVDYSTGRKFSSDDKFSYNISQMENWRNFNSTSYKIFKYLSMMAFIAEIQNSKFANI